MYYVELSAVLSSPNQNSGFFVAKIGTITIKTEEYLA
jgi:hypothetical protein